MKIKLGESNISVALFLYWLVLVVWQNISTVTNRSGFDLVLKVGLLAYLILCFAFRAGLKLYNPALITIFVFTQLVTFLFEQWLTLSVYISYFYTIVIVILVFGMGRFFTVSKADLIRFYDAVIVVALYAALYALIFCTDQFTSAFTIKSAYGNELKSFFFSSHEYALYIAAGIICCVIGIDVNRGESTGRSVFYIISLVLLIPNLILSFSRTAMFGTACFFFIYIFGAKNSRFKKWIVLGCIIAVLVYFSSSQIHSFVNDIVLKGNHLAGRDTLYETAGELFLEGSVMQQLFGYGISYSRIELAGLTKHGSVHNAYLQVLLYFGLIGLAWLVGLVLSQIVKHWNLCSVNRYWGAVFLGLIVWAGVMMYTNTFILFTSSIDCYFLTIFAVIVPLYSANAIRQGTFDLEA